MADFTSRFNELTARHVGNDTDLGAALGVSKQTISAWRTGTRSPKKPHIVAIAKYFNVGIPWLMGISDYETEYGRASFGKSIDGLIPRDQLRTRRVPILGDTAAGEPVIANRVYDEWVDVPDDGHRYDAALHVTGDSMAPKFHKGDLVFVKYQEDVEDGQIAVVCLDDGVTLKRVYHVPGGLSLLSDNPLYPPQNYSADDIGNAHLVGLAVGVLHWDY